MSYITSNVKAEMALSGELKGEVDAVIGYIINNATWPVIFFNAASNLDGIPIGHKWNGIRSVWNTESSRIPLRYIQATRWRCLGQISFRYKAHRFAPPLFNICFWLGADIPRGWQDYKMLDFLAQLSLLRAQNECSKYIAG